jgi:hypothetical protein
MHSFLAPSAPKFAHSIPRRPKISFGCTHDFRVKMWGTSSPKGKLAGDLGNVIEATSIRGRRSNFFTAGKLAPRHLGLLQQYRHKAALLQRSGMSAAGER